MNEPWFSALGDGWLGKLIAGLLCASLAWIARRPTEQAAVLLAVDQRMQTIIKTMGEQLDAAIQRCDAANAKHEACEAKLTDMQSQIDAMMAGLVAEYTTIKRPTT